MVQSSISFASPEASSHPLQIAFSCSTAAGSPRVRCTAPTTAPTLMPSTGRVCCTIRDSSWRACCHFLGVRKIEVESKILLSTKRIEKNGKRRRNWKRGENDRNGESVLTIAVRIPGFWKIFLSNNISHGRGVRCKNPGVLDHLGHVSRPLHMRSGQRYVQRRQGDRRLCRRNESARRDVHQKLGYVLLIH